jgi:hypothetical protein
VPRDLQGQNVHHVRQPIRPLRPKQAHAQRPRLRVGRGLRGAKPCHGLQDVRRHNTTRHYRIVAARRRRKPGTTSTTNGGPTGAAGRGLARRQVLRGRRMCEGASELLRREGRSRRGL